MARPALEVSLSARRWEDGARGEEPLPSLFILPTNSADRRKDPTGSTFLIGRIVSTPVPRSASLTTVPDPFKDVLSLYDDRRVPRMEPE